ncbi:DNA mismatch repair protein Mlh3 isoform X2 [Heterodontus francisci]|uniref:DNA mismatch repair protein Mlh3 isoform X2 n=1 Tax=Heterodontus francisci TaxID=7792 RepID=UPI00355C283F
MGEAAAGARGLPLAHSVRPLPEVTQTRLRSGVAVPSLAHCLEELLLNSLAAGCGCVAARVDAQAGRVQVADNGAGLERAALELAGTRYHSSGGHGDGPGPGPGSRGEALASIAHLSGLLEIVSRPQRGSSQTWVKIFRNGQARPVYEAETGRPSPGTTVTVCNLFYQLPVRCRRLGRPLEWEQIRRRVQALSFLHPGVSFTVRDEASATAGGSLVVRLPKASSLQARFAQIHGPQKAMALGRVHYSSGGFQLSGFISRRGHHSKAQRLVFVSGRLVLKTRIHKELDSLLRRYSMICKPEPGTGSRGGADLQPVYIINIDCDHVQYDACWETNRTLLEFTAWDLLLCCLEEGVRAFLLREQLLVEPTEEQGSVRLAVDSSGIRHSHERVAVQSKLVHRQAVGVETPGQEAHSESCDALSQEKVRADSEDPAEPPLYPGQCRLSCVEAPKHSLHFAGLQPGSKSQQEEEGNTSLRDLSTSAGPETQTADSAQPGIAICQLVAAYESETLSVTESSSQEGEQVGAEESLGKQAGAEGSQGVQVRELRGEQVSERKLSGEEGGKLQGEEVQELGGEQGGMVKPQRDEELWGHQAVELGNMGLITHVVHRKTINAGVESGNSSDWRHICRPGPVSAWEIINERTRKGDGQLMPGDRALSNVARECRRAIPQGSVTDCQRIQGTSQYHHHSESSAESVTISRKINLPKDLSNSEYRYPAKCEPVCCQARFHRKLSMSLITGSLDIFRRNYGKISDQDGRSSSQGSVAIQHSAGESAMRPSDNVPVTKGVENLYRSPNVKYADSATSYQNESSWHNHCDCGGLLRRLCSDRTFPAAGHVSSLIALPGYSQAKKMFSVAKEPPRTLAAKLSRLKDLKKVQPTEEKNGGSKVGSSTEQCQHCQSYEGLLQPEQECASPELVCSAAQVISENSTLRERMVGEEWQVNSSGATTESVQCTINSASCSDNLCCTATDERTGNGTVTQFDLHVGDQSQSDKASDANLNPSMEDSVATWQVSDPVHVLTKPVLDGQLPGGCVETCKGQSDSLKAFASDWLQYFDGSLGKMVYVNSVTGLSSYEVPPDAQTQTACIKDFTTMAVNVLTKTGAQFGSSDSLHPLFLEWMNPVFIRPPEVAVNVSNEQAGTFAVKIHNILYPYRFTKDMISSMQVLNQVDNKFIACLINTRDDKGATTGGNLLVLVDQHAAHERVRLEQLISDCYEVVPEAASHRKLCTSTVCPPMEISCTQDEARLLRLYWKQLEAAGVQVEFRDAESPGILVKKVPACFIEKEANEIRRGRQPVTQAILKEFLQEQIEVLQSTGGFPGVLSRTVLKVLSSQACHGAVKFGDELSLEECRSLMESLASCDLPFQCAHGRPSMLPLADLNHLEMEKEVHHRPNLQKLHKLCEVHLSGGSV